MAAVHAGVCKVVHHTTAAIEMGPAMRGRYHAQSASLAQRNHSTYRGQLFKPNGVRWPEGIQ